MLAYTHRFHGHNSLKYVYKNGQALRNPVVTIRYVKNSRRKLPRVAVVVSKKVYKGAVGRNRIRRRIYEWFRVHIAELNENYDIVCIVTSAELRTMPASEIEQLFLQLTAPLLDKTRKK